MAEKNRSQKEERRIIRERDREWDGGIRTRRETGMRNTDGSEMKRKRNNDGKQKGKKKEEKEGKREGGL